MRGVDPGCDVGDHELVHAFGVQLREEQDGFSTHAVAEQGRLRDALCVHEVHDILGHGLVGVNGLVGGAAVVSGIQHPHVMRSGVPLAQRLPIVRAAQQPVKDEQVGCLVPEGGGKVSRVKGHHGVWRHARYCATALDRPRYRASEIRACPMLTSSRWGTLSAKSRRLARLRS